MANGFSAIKPAIWGNESRVIAGFSTRTAPLEETHPEFNGDARVESNRKQWLEIFGLGNRSLALAKQVHGSEVRIVSDAACQDNTDGLVTTQKNLAVGVLVADCAAVLLADQENEVIAAVHAGWRGAIDGILKKAIAKMLLSGANVNRIEAFISPCISVKAFEVGKDVADLFPVQFVDYKSYEKPHIDLKKFVMSELLISGLHEENIECNPLCTVNEPETLHSYRRDKARSGRMMAVISMDSPGP